MTLYADGGMGMVSAPAVFGDGAVLPPGGAAELFADVSSYNAVPVILGTNRDEVKLFMAMSPEWVDYRFGFLPTAQGPGAVRSFRRLRIARLAARRGGQPRAHPARRPG